MPILWARGDGMMEFVHINSLEDFTWYCKGLDVAGRYNHLHLGKPEKYPCKVVSIWRDDPNGPYTYYHKFIYLQDVVCPECGHKSCEWPKIDSDSLGIL